MTTRHDDGYLKVVRVSKSTLTTRFSQQLASSSINGVTGKVGPGGTICLADYHTMFVGHNFLRQFLVTIDYPPKRAGACGAVKDYRGHNHPNVPAVSIA